MTERGVFTESALRETVGGINPKYSTEGEKEHEKKVKKDERGLKYLSHNRNNWGGARWVKP